MDVYCPSKTILIGLSEKGEEDGEKGREEVAWQQHSSLKCEEAQEAGRLYFLPLHLNASVNTKITKAREMECRGDAGLRQQKT